MAEASVAVAGQVATAHELGGGLPVGPPCGVQAGFRCGVLLGGEHTAELNAAPRRGSLRTFDLSMDEWLDACDEASWIGTPPPPSPWADGAWGPWDDNPAWWNYPQAEARAYRNQRFFQCRCWVPSPPESFMSVGHEARCAAAWGARTWSTAPRAVAWATMRHVASPVAHGVGCGRRSRGMTPALYWPVGGGSTTEGG